MVGRMNELRCLVRWSRFGGCVMLKSDMISSADWGCTKVVWSTALWASGTVPDSAPRALKAMLYGRTVKMWEWWWRSFGGEFNYGNFDVGVGLRKILDFVMVVTPDAPRKVRSELIGKCNAFWSVRGIHERNGVKIVLTPF